MEEGLWKGGGDVAFDCLFCFRRQWREYSVQRLSSIGYFFVCFKTVSRKSNSLPSHFTVWWIPTPSGIPLLSNWVCVDVEGMDETKKEKKKKDLVNLSKSVDKSTQDANRTGREIKKREKERAKPGIPVYELLIWRPRRKKEWNKEKRKNKKKKKKRGKIQKKKYIERGMDRRMLRVDHHSFFGFFWFCFVCFLSQRRLARCRGQWWIRAWMSWTTRVSHSARGAQVTVVGSETSLQGDHQLSRTGLVSMFAQPNALPSAQRQTAVANRQCQRRSQEASFDMGGHIVRAFARVSIRQALRDDSI